MEGQLGGNAESREKMMQAKRLWNLRWCHDWYNKKLEVEERLHRGRPVSQLDVLRKSTLAACVIQQVLQLTSSDSESRAEDLFGISETSSEPTTGQVDINDPLGKNKYNLLKTPLHYIKILKNKVPSRFRNKLSAEKTVDDATLLSSTLKFTDEVEQAQSTGTPFDMSSDLIDFVSRRAGNTDFGLFVLQCPACHFQQVIAASGLDIPDLLTKQDSSEVRQRRARNWMKSFGSYRIVRNMEHIAQPVPKSPILRLSDERMHSRLCAYYIIGMIVRRITNSSSFHFLKQCKNVIHNRVNNINFSFSGTMSPKLMDFKKTLHSSFSYPAQNLPHPYIMANREYGVFEALRYNNNGDLRQRDELADLRNVCGGHMKETGRSRLSDSSIIRPRPCSTRENYGFTLLNDANKSKTL